MKRTLLFIFGTVFIVVLISFCLMASAHLGEDKLPSAEDIIEKYLKATGGRRAHENIQNKRTEYKIDSKTSGIEIDFTYYQERPNKAYSILDMGAMGKTRIGSDGKVVWEISPLTGTRVLEGEELATRLLGYTFDGPDAWKGLFKRVITEGIEDINERPCYKVVFTPNQGPPRVKYYDMKSFLLVKYINEVKNPSGTYKIETFPEDYRKTGEILSAHKLTSHFMGQVIVGVVKSIETNISMPEGIFDLPEEIEKLISGEIDSVSPTIKKYVSPDGDITLDIPGNWFILPHVKEYNEIVRFGSTEVGLTSIIYHPAYMPWQSLEARRDNQQRINSNYGWKDFSNSETVIGGRKTLIFDCNNGFTSLRDYFFEDGDYKYMVAFFVNTKDGIPADMLEVYDRIMRSYKIVD